MQSTITRNGRINQLFKLALKGATEEEIITKAMAMGVTRETAKGYFGSVRSRLMQVDSFYKTKK